MREGLFIVFKKSKGPSLLNKGKHQKKRSKIVGKMFTLNYSKKRSCFSHCLSFHSSIHFFNCPNIYFMLQQRINMMSSGQTISSIMLWNKHYEIPLKSIPSSTKLAPITFDHLLLKISLLTNFVQEIVS